MLMEISRKSLKYDGATMAIISKPKPLTLKDYLRRDDLSSCSSSGFRSFPRKQCCTTTTIRLLLEIDLKSTKPSSSSCSSSNIVIKRSRSRAASSTVSALHRASVKFVNAVKLLSLPSVRSPLVQSNGVKRGWFFPRTLLSLKFSKRSSSKKQPEGEEKESNNENEIKRWRLVREFLEEKEQDHQPLDQNTSQGALSHCVSKHNSSSWGSSEFTSESLDSSLSSASSNSGSSSNENDAVVAVVEKKEEKIGVVSEREGVTGGKEEDQSTEVATPSSKIHWPNEAKEQFSPVSILDCPFKDDEEISLRDSPPCTEGPKPKLMSKFSLFARLDQLEPIDLDKRIAASNLDNGSIDYHLQSSALSRHDRREEEEEENEIISEIVEELLRATKIRNPSCDYVVVNLLSDFFIEKLEENNVNIGKSRGELDVFNHDYLLKLAEDWLNGHHLQELILGWEVESERKAYVRDMEKGGKWRNFNGELEEVALDLEVEIWDSLMEEVFVV